VHALPPAEIVASVAAPVAEPPSIFERSRDATAGHYDTVLLPGISYDAWRPLRPGQAETSGAGLEVSLVHWLGTDVYVGAVTQAEKLDRYRIGGGIEAGFQYVGLETSLVRELADRDGRGGQWSLQIAPYASLGMAYVAARWIVAFRDRDDAPGSGAMIVVGVKIPIVLGGSR
jgi:hypothetical protein